jgi:hypothetical protein
MEVMALLQMDADFYLAFVMPIFQLIKVPLFFITKNKVNILFINYIICVHPYLSVVSFFFGRDNFTAKTPDICAT